MNSIDAKSIIPGVDHRLTHLPEALTLVGIPVPSALSSGLARARWKLPTPDIATAEKAVTNAKTEADFQTAVTELAAVQVTSEVLKAQPMRLVADRARITAAENGFRASYPDIMASVITAYNGKVSTFRDDLQTVPNLQGRSAYDLSADEAKSLWAARDIASCMTDLLNVYQTIAALAGYPGTGSTRDVPGAMSLLSCIAVFRSGRELEMAATDLVRYRIGEGQHGPLAPHATAVWHADHVELVEPDDAAERYSLALHNWDGSNTG